MPPVVGTLISVAEIMKLKRQVERLDCELQQLKFQNKWLRDANIALLQKVRSLHGELPPEALV
jgi:hypothetical protein